MSERKLSANDVVSRILLEDDGLIVVDKPAGLPSTGQHLSDPDSLQFLLMAHFRRMRIWAVHQLDKETTGLNLFVRRKALVQVWAQRLAESEKRYRAFVAGTMREDGYVVDVPLGFCPKRHRRAVRKDGKAALSRVKVLARYHDVTEVSVTIATGRTHQVRLHMEHLGHPILGDKRYAPDEIASMHPRLALHAEAIRWSTGDELRAALPEDLRALQQGVANDEVSRGEARSD